MPSSMEGSRLDRFEIERVKKSLTYCYYWNLEVCVTWAIWADLQLGGGGGGGTPSTPCLRSRPD